MSYFNHAFKKTMVAQTVSGLSGVQLGTSTTNMLKPGQITFIDPKTFTVAPQPSGCCDVIIATGSLMKNDKIGPFAGGYLESNKTKTIRPKYVSRLYYAPANEAERYVTHVGYTPWTYFNAPSSSKPGETAGYCCKPFLCGETYYLRLDVKGSPALRLLNHNAYLTLEGYTGCCADDTIAPTPVDPRKVYIAWALQILNSPLINPFIYPVVTFSNNAGISWTYYYPNDVDLTALPVIVGVTYQHYSDWTETPYVDTMCAGIVLTGAYYETKFENCTFQVTDFYELEPVRVYASEVDYTGSPCEFEALCVGVECYGRQVNGIGETVVRDVILSESYRQNHFATDFRIREITQGYDILNAAGISRTGLYDRIYLQHNVPRLYNPTGTFDNDQYLVELVVKQGDNVALDSVWKRLLAWLENCSECNIQDIGEGVPCASQVVPLPGDEAVIG
jgi:hypothetical protein